MKKIKYKLFLAALCLALALPLAACGNTPQPTDNPTTQAPAIPTENIDLPSPYEEATAEAPTEPPTQVPTDNPADEPTAELPTELPIEENTETAEEPAVDTAETGEPAEPATEEAPTAEPVTEESTTETTEAAAEAPTAYDETTAEALAADVNVNVNINSLYGLYVMENTDFGRLSLEFLTTNVFTATFEGAGLDIGMDLPGSFAITGAYVLDTAAQTITLSIREEDMLAVMEDLVGTFMDDILLVMMEEQFGDILGDLLEDEEAMGAIITLMLGSINIFLDEIVEALEGITEAIEEMVLTFGEDFSRLYSHQDVVFVRQ